jgi:uncharacterized protein YecE (DUF72 family)
MQRKFDYSYSDEELDGVSGTISGLMQQARSGVVFFNNHVRGQAVENARGLESKLR